MPICTTIGDKRSLFLAARSCQNRIQNNVASKNHLPTITIQPAAHPTHSNEEDEEVRKETADRRASLVITTTIMPAAATSRPAGHIHDGGAGDRFYIPASFRKGTAASPSSSSVPARPAPSPARPQQQQQQQHRSYQPSVPNRTATTVPSSSSASSTRRPVYQNDGIRVGAGGGGIESAAARPSLSSAPRPYHHPTGDGIRVSASPPPAPSATTASGHHGSSDGIRVRPGGLMMSGNSSRAPPKQSPPSRRMTHPSNNNNSNNSSSGRASKGTDDGIRVRPGGGTERGGTPNQPQPSYHHRGGDGIRVRAVY